MQPRRRPRRDGNKMAAKKKGSSSSKTRTVYVTKKKQYRRKSGTAQIPAAAATIGMVIANKDPIMNVVNNPSIDSAKQSFKYALQPEQIKKTVIHGAAGLVIGAGVKKFAPKAIKTPLGKIAKKIPKVI